MPSFEQIINFIEKKVRPSLQLHFGDIEFLSLDGNIIKVRLVGACAHCPSSAVTLHEGVEKMIQAEFGAFFVVEQVWSGE